MGRRGWRGSLLQGWDQIERRPQDRCCPVWKEESTVFSVLQVHHHWDVLLYKINTAVAQGPHAVTLPALKPPCT